MYMAFSFLTRLLLPSSKNNVIERVVDKIKKIKFPNEWCGSVIWDVQEKVGKILANVDSEDDIIDKLPKRIRINFRLAEFQEAIYCDGFFSVFYNCDYREIMRFRATLEEIGECKLVSCFDRGLQLFKSKFSWDDETTNFVCQVYESPYDYFGTEISDQFDEIEKEITAIFETEECVEKLSAIWNSEKE